MRRIVLGTFLLAEIAGIVAYVAADRAGDPASFDLDGAPFGDVLSQAYDDIAWANLVRRSMLAEGSAPMKSVVGEYGEEIRPEEGVAKVNILAPGTVFAMPVTGLPEAAFPPSVRDSRGLSGTGQIR